MSRREKKKVSERERRWEWRYLLRIYVDDNIIMLAGWVAGNSRVSIPNSYTVHIKNFLGLSSIVKRLTSHDLAQTKLIIAGLTRERQHSRGWVQKPKLIISFRPSSVHLEWFIDIIRILAPSHICLPGLPFFLASRADSFISVYIFLRLHLFSSHSIRARCC